MFPLSLQASSEDLPRLSLPHVYALIVAPVVLIAAYSAWKCAYNLFFHPLSHIPGPFWTRATGIPYTLRLRNGNIAPWIQALHQRYGEVVRVTPTECSFISGETAWQDIYGFRTHATNKGHYSKDLQWFPPPNNGTYSLVGADEETHSRMRRHLSHAFSDKALRNQEELIQGFIDLLVSRLREAEKEGEGVVDIMRWYNYTTFDIITDLTFGEPLYCLRDKGYHPWVDLTFGAAKSIGLLATRRKYPLWNYYDKFKGYFTFSDSSKAIGQRLQFFKLVTEKVQDRIDLGVDVRPDFMSHILRNNGLGEKGLSFPEMVANSALLMVAGSETTATLLSGATYLLLANPRVYSKLTEAIRSHFSDPSQITINEVVKVPYLIAVLQESLRYYPPVPTGYPRVVPKGGDKISGHYLPEGTSVYVSQHASNHSTRNFTDPDDFVPERWMEDREEKYVDDKREIVQPFLIGPRNCLGKNLAYAEMRVILAKILFAFDLELQPASKDWLARNKVFSLWEKPALLVKLRSVEH